MSKFLIPLMLLSLPSAVAAQPVATTADFAGTWNVELMSHQIALVIEAKDATKVTATLMMPGRELHLKGDLVGRTLTLVGDKAAMSERGGAAPEGHAVAGIGGPAPAGALPSPKPITATLLEDGTLRGEMTTVQGSTTWTAERLKTKKK